MDGFFAGIDSGSTYCKGVVVDGREGRILGTGLTPMEADVKGAASRAMQQALTGAGLKKAKQIQHIVVTGRNSKRIPFKGEEFPSMVCVGKGAFTLCPRVRTVVDVGGFTNKAVKLNDSGKVMEYIVNERCASGSGFFMELVARALETDVSQLGQLALQSANPVPVTSQCSIFAESEVIYLVNEGKQDQDVAAGVCLSISNRIFSLLKRVHIEPEIALTGGVANNEMIQQALEKSTGQSIAGFPVNPIYTTAYGAAIIARERFQSK